MFKNYEEIKADILNQVSEVDKREGSFVADMVSPISMEIEAAYEAMKGILSKRFLVNETGADLDIRAGEYGISRKPGTKSTGIIQVNGVNGSVVPKGSLFSTAYGLIFESIEAAEIADLSALISIEATEIGDAYNVAVGAINEIPISISGISSCTNPNSVTGGSNVESDVDLQNRLLLRIRNPSTSGNAAHYKEWALEVPGIGDAKVLPLRDGNGTVTVIPVTSDRRAPNLQLQTDVVTNIEQKKPIGATVTVLEATEVPININANLIIDSNIALAEISEAYEEKFSAYIKSSVFKLQVVDYFKCLSLFYEISGVQQVSDFILNGGTSNASIGETEIQVVGVLTILQEES